jgi:catechol 2,3-dioxygenase-like lactoylglutathione lyase family enzyme
MILAFAHPCLVVPDLEKARQFYERMFGFEVIGEEGWKDSRELDQATGLLFEFQAPESEGRQPRFLDAHEPGIRHLAFYVDDCWAEYQRLQDLGGMAMGVPAGDDDNGYAVYCRDPFGNIIELAEIPGPQECPTQLPGISRLAGLNEA